MSDALLVSLWRASWQGAVVVAALWCVCRVFEARHWLSANLRCWLWRGAYIKLLLGLFMMASVALPLLPPVVPVAGLPEATSNREPIAFVSAPLPAVQHPATSETVERYTVENGPRVTWHTVLAALYLLGVGVCVFRVGHKGLATRRVLKEADAKNAGADNAQIIAEIVRLAPLFGLRQTPRLLRSPNVSVPCYAARTVLLPADTDYTAPEVRLILAHELAHAKRCDLAWEWLGTLAQIVFFFHPLVWLARREERLCREAAADALALRGTQARAADYGNLLLRFSLTRAGEPLAGVIGIVDRGTLFRRRLLCLGEDFSMRKPVDAWKRWMVSTTLFACVSFAVFVPWSLQAQARQIREETAPQGNRTTARKRRDKYTLYYESQERLRKEANAAIASGKTTLATQLAQQMLKNNTSTKDWNYGNIVHQANQILGLAALQEGRTGDAKRYLLAAGKTPGSPQLNSFGPNMVLAQRLLEKGEKNAVLQYLDAVSLFWGTHQNQLDDWKRQIGQGKVPTLNRNYRLE